MTRADTATAARWLGGAVCLLAAVGAAGARTLAPGLWEVTSRTVAAEASAGATAPAADAAPSGNVAEMAKLSPEQRRMMAEMKAARGAGPAATDRTVRVCLTPAQAERDLIPAADPACRVQDPRRQGDTVRLVITCDGNTLARGEGEATLSGPTGYRGRFVVDTVIDGQPRRSDVQVSGRWLAADCGSVAPIR